MEQVTVQKIHNDFKSLNDGFYDQAFISPAIPGC